MQATELLTEVGPAFTIERLRFRFFQKCLKLFNALWLDDDRTLVDEFSTIIKDLVEYDFSIAEEQMKERLNIA